MTQPARPWCLFLAIAVALPACALGQVSTPSLSQADSIKATQALIRWFECMPCNGTVGDPELQAVRAFGSAVVPSLNATCKSGLSPAHRAALQAALGARYDALVEQAARDPRFTMASTKDQFIARYVKGLDDRYRLRAKQALDEMVGGTNTC